MIYILHFFVITILYIWFGRFHETKKIFVNSSFVYVIFIFGQRWMTGTDFPNYLRFYIYDITRGEWGYFGLQTLLRNNNLYFGLLIMLILFITQINFYRFFLKFKKYATLMIFIFLISEIFFAQMSQMRQYVAISFFLNSYYHASVEKNYIMAFINIFFAASFHTIAIFFIPFLFIQIPISRKQMLVLLVIALVLPFIDIRMIFELPIFNRYSHYVGSRFDVPLGFNHYIKYFVFLFLFIYYAITMKKVDMNRNYRMILNGLLLYVAIYGMSFNFAPLYRVATFFQTFEIVFLIYYMKDLKELPSFVTKKVITALFLGLFFFSSLSDSYSVSRYEFRPLRLYENKSVEQLNHEIDTFYN